MKNIVLIGYRCTGKTEVGRAVSRMLSFQFIDTDGWVEKDASMNISQIVANRGWGEFRDIEKKIIARVSKQTGAVVCTGGGAVLDGENVANLKRNGVVIWLGARPDVILKRMQKDPKTKTQRPTLVEGEDALSEIKDTLVERLEKYETASDYRIDTSDITMDEVAGKVMRIYKRVSQEV